MGPAIQRRVSFTGEHISCLDPQRRLVLPKAWRQPDPEENVFTLMAPDKPCIHMLPPAMMERFYERLQARLLTEEDGLIDAGSLGRMAADIACDKQGRFALTSELMAHAGIEDRVVMVGNFVSIAIWAPDVWAAHRKSLSEGNRAMREMLRQPDALAQAVQQALKPQAAP